MSSLSKFLQIGLFENIMPEPSPVTIAPETALIHAAVTMNRQQVDVLAVVENQIPVGLLTAGDIVRGVAEGLDFTRVKVAEVTGNLPPILKRSELGDRAALLKSCDRARTDYLMVVGDRDELVGLISRAGLLKDIDLEGVGRALITLQERVDRLEAENAEIRDRNREKLEQVEGELNDLTSRFITTISHEFRTPLTTISFSAGLLESHGKKFSEEKQQTHFRRIKSGIRQMTEMLNDIFIIGQAEAGRLVPNPSSIDIREVCRRLVEEFQLTTDKHDLIFNDRTDGSTAYLDADLLEQIFGNLISNAIKYSPQGGEIEIDLIGGGDRVTFRIQDRGIGIPKKDREYLFEPFHRASNVGTISGTGLGLPLVKKAVELQGGEITVDGEENGGTTCTVILPLKLKK